MKYQVIPITYRGQCNRPNDTERVQGNTRQCVHGDSHISDATHRDKGHERIEEDTVALLAFVRDYLFRSADASSRPDIGDRDTGRGCGRTVDVGSGFSGA